MNKIGNKKRLVSGIRPTEQLHIGNYLGALRNWIKLQDEYECFFFAADLHALTTENKPGQYINDLVRTYLACGLNSKKCTIFVQSHVHEHSELAWIFNCLISVPELERMTQFKELSENQIPNAGLLTYPCLMAADILLYKAEGVPVGEDQVQHVEITRMIARKFNQKYGKIFPEPKAILTKVPRLKSLQRPETKMSKNEPKGCLFLSDSPQIIKQKISTAVTDIGPGKKMSPGVENLFILLEAFEGDIEKFKKQYQDKTLQYVDLKKAVSQVIIKELKPIQERKSGISEKNIKQILKDGAQRAREIASQTMKEVRTKIGLM